MRESLWSFGRIRSSKGLLWLMRRKEGGGGRNGSRDMSKEVLGMTWTIRATAEGKYKAHLWEGFILPWFWGPTNHMFAPRSSLSNLNLSLELTTCAQWPAGHPISGSRRHYRS